MESKPVITVSVAQLSKISLYSPVNLQRRNSSYCDVCVRD